MAGMASSEITHLSNVDIKYLVSKTRTLLSDRGAVVSHCFTRGGLKADPLMGPTRGSVSVSDRDIPAMSGDTDISSSISPPEPGKNSGSVWDA